MIDAAELAQLRAEHARALELIGLLEADQVRSEGIIAGLGAERDVMRASMTFRVNKAIRDLVEWLEADPDNIYHLPVDDVATLRRWLHQPAAIITATEGLE